MKQAKSKSFGKSGGAHKGVGAKKQGGVIYSASNTKALGSKKG